MASINKAILVGRVGRDPECKHMTDGTMICSFSLATSEKYKDKETTEWHNISAFGKLAEICQQYVAKGSLLYVEGKIQTKKWQDKDGKDRYTTSIKSDQMRMLSSKDQGTYTNESVPVEVSDGIPF